MRKLFGMTICGAWAHTVGRGFLRPLDITLCCACVGHWPGAGQFCLRFGCCGGVVGVAVMGGGWFGFLGAEFSPFLVIARSWC